MAWEVFKGLDAMDLARVDFRLDPDNRPFVLELNAIPGFTESSLLPKAAAAAGFHFQSYAAVLLRSLESLLINGNGGAIWGFCQKVKRISFLTTLLLFIKVQYLRFFFLT